MVSYSKVEKFLSEWKGASVKELKARLKRLQTKVKTSDTLAEIKALEGLLN